MPSLYLLQMLFSSIDSQYIFSLSDGEPLKLPESLESLPKSDHFPNQRHRWNTNEVSVSNIILSIFEDNQTILKRLG